MSCSPRDGRNRLGEDDQLFLEESLAADAARTIRDAEILARQLAMQATMMHEIDPSLSAQIALVAHSTASTLETRSALLSASSPLPGRRFLGGPGPTALTISGNGRRAAYSNSLDGTVTVLEQSVANDDSPVGDRRNSFRRARTVHCVSPNTNILGLALSADGRLLGVGGSDGAITLVDLETGNGATIKLDTRAMDVTGAIMTVAFNRSGSQLFAGGTAAGIGHWKVGPGPTAEFIQLVAAPGTTMSVAVGDDRLLASSSIDGRVAIHLIDDAANLGSPAWTTSPAIESPASAVALSTDGSMLLAGFRSGTIRVWRLSSPTNIEEIELSFAPFASWVNSVAICADAPPIAAASSDGNVRLWNTETWHEVRPDLRHPTVVTGVEFGPGPTLLTTAEDGTARTWSLDHAAPDKSNHTIWSLTIDQMGEHLTAASRNAIVSYGVLADGQITPGTNLPAPSDSYNLSGASSISPDGSIVVSGTRQGALSVARLGNAAQPPELLDGLRGLVEHIRFSADGTLFAAVDDAGEAQLWTVDRSGKVARAGAVTVAPPALGVAFSSDGSLLAVSSESSEVHLFDIANPSAPTPVTVINAGDSFAISVAFHPTMPVLAAGNADRSVTLWDCASPAAPTLLHRLAGPGGHIMTLAFDRAGDRLAAGLTDGKTWIWNTTDLTSVAVHACIASDGGGVYAITFSPNGRHLFAAGPHHQIDSWILDETHARAVLQAAVGDAITPDEWSALIPTLPYSPPV